jgi:hypothetical protein
MSAGITLDEMLTWNDQASAYWKAHFDANPLLLDLPCDIGGAANVQEFERLAGVPVTAREKIPAGPLDALFDMHRQAVEMFRNLLAAPEESWSGTYVLEFDWVPEEERAVSRRKIAAHALFHSQRHWAQLATLVRNAGFPSNFRGDLLFSPALR